MKWLQNIVACFIHPEFIICNVIYGNLSFKCFAQTVSFIFRPIQNKIGIEQKVAHQYIHCCHASLAFCLKLFFQQNTLVT